MTGYVIIGALVFLFVSDALYRSVVTRAKPLFPLSLQEERRASFALGALLWERSFPADLRRKYLLSIGSAALAVFCVALFAYITGHSNWAVFFAGLLLCVAVHGLVAWTKHRKRL